MKIFICADMEGITTSTTWDNVDSRHGSYSQHAKQMTDEVLACIQGAKEAGATEIVIKDAHDTALNIDPTVMPSGVKLLRGWSGHPYSMVEGIDKTFDAAMFVGHHSAAGKVGNPLAHTYTGRCNYVKINGRLASEFMIYSYACAMEGIPTVFLSGDKMLCDDSKDLHPKLMCCPVKEGIGAMTISYSPTDNLANIKKLSKEALSQELKNAVIELPSHFEVEFCFKEHKVVEKVSYFPGMVKKSDYILTFETDNFFEVLRTIVWVL